MDIKEIAKIISEANKIGIAFHTSPDGDAIGSTLGLLSALRQLKQDAYVISREVIPDNLSFLPLASEIDGTVYEPTNGTDLVIVLDCGSADRVCADIADYEGCIINFDHHITNEKYGTINYIEEKSAATAEMIFLLVEELGLKFETKTDAIIRVGTCIYTGILTDTGSFRHSNVTERTHVITSKLIASGVKNNAIHSNLYENRPFKKVKLIGEALGNLELFLKNRVAYIELSKKLLESFNLGNVDTSDIISMALSIENVEVAVVVKEVDDGVKGSLRSKANFDVRKVAEALGGGGHVKAAGLKLKKNSLSQAKDKILNEIAKGL